MASRPTDGEQLVTELLRLWRATSEGEAAMPSEPQLVELTGASRNSVREALVRLEERGYIHRSQGARTTINMRLGDIGTRVDQQRDHLDAITTAGYEGQVTLLSADVVTLGADSQGFHDLPDGTRVLRTVKVWSADSTPYVLAEDLVPIRLDDVDVDAIDATRPVFDLAEQLSGIRVAWETVWFTPILLSETEAPVLRSSPQTPALELVYCGIGTTDVAAYWCREVQVTAPDRLRNALVRRVSR